jgi:ABC-2 type transport system permease protein
MRSLLSIVHIAVKDFNLLVRDRANAFFTFVFPLLIAVFFGAVFGGINSRRNGIDLAIVNLDGSPASVRLTRSLASDGAFKLHKRDTREDAVVGVQRGKLHGALIVPAGYGEKTRGVFMGEQAQLEVIVDPGRWAEAAMLKGKVCEHAFRQVGASFTDPAVLEESVGEAERRLETSADLSPTNKAVLGTLLQAMRGLARSGLTPMAAGAQEKEEENTPTLGGWEPVRVKLNELESERTKSRSGYDISFAQGAVWAFAMAAAGFAASLAAERRRGTMPRLLTAPIARTHIVLGKALACFVTCLIVQVVLYGVMHSLGVRVDDKLMFVGAMLAASFCFAGFMAAVAGLCKTESAAEGLGRGAIILLALVGGGSIPLAFMPEFVRKINLASPFRWATQAIDGAVWRQFSWQEMLLPIAILSAIGLVGLVVGSLVLRPKEA